ncbi:hypothetical protein DFH06DRAFT_1125013 [Mycena polygramma]|nr:hypothetical protein DFH06DRAFT_1125013 [Mycena polygramma]
MIAMQPSTSKHIQILSPFFFLHVPFTASVPWLPPGTDTRPMSELHLTKAEYAQYKRHSSPNTMYKDMADKKGKKLRVIGFNEDTKAVFRTCNPKGHDYIEVPWDSMDSVVCELSKYDGWLAANHLPKTWIVQRLEDKIRVAMHHWFLATADGVIIPPLREPASSPAAFRVEGQIVLTLLMPTDLPTYVAYHLKQHKWKRTTPLPCAFFSSKMGRCIAEYQLVDAQPSPAWDAYLVQRRAADKAVTDNLKAAEGEDRPVGYELIEHAVDELLDIIDLDGAESCIHDCVASAEILSRIYSPTNPAAVDVYLEYHYRTRYESVEFMCNVFYRAHPLIKDRKLDLSTPRTPMRMNGFRTLFRMGLKDVPPGRRWRAIDKRMFALTAPQARTLHRVLFGEASASVKGVESKSTALADKIGVPEMVQLLLASVGIAFYPATDPLAKDDGDAFTEGELRWEGIEGSERWLGRHVRSVARCVAMGLQGGLPPMSRDPEDVSPDKDDEDEAAWEDVDSGDDGEDEDDCRGEAQDGPEEEADGGWSGCWLQ